MYRFILFVSGSFGGPRPRLMSFHSSPPLPFLRRCRHRCVRYTTKTKQQKNPRKKLPTHRRILLLGRRRWGGENTGRRGTGNWPSPLLSAAETPHPAPPMPPHTPMPPLVVVLFSRSRAPSLFILGSAPFFSSLLVLLSPFPNQTRREKRGAVRGGDKAEGSENSHPSQPTPPPPFIPGSNVWLA